MGLPSYRLAARAHSLEGTLNPPPNPVAHAESPLPVQMQRKGYCFWADGPSVTSFCPPQDCGPPRAKVTHLLPLPRTGVQKVKSVVLRAGGRVLSGASKSVFALPAPLLLCSPPPPQHSQLFPETRVMTCSSFCLNLCFRQATSRSSAVKIWWVGRKGGEGGPGERRGKERGEKEGKKRSRGQPNLKFPGAERK